MKTPYKSLKERGRPLTEVVVDGCTVYAAPVPKGMRLGIVNPKGAETSLVLTNEQFSRLLIGAEGKNEP